MAAGCGGATYWLAAELRGVWRLRSAERLKSLIPFAMADELKAEIDMAAANLNLRDPVMYRILHAEHHRTALSRAGLPD